MAYRPASANCPTFISAARKLLSFSTTWSGATPLVSATLAAGIICWRRAKQLLDMADLAGAMSLEALKGSPVAYDPRIHRARPHRGQVEVAERLSRFLRESEIRDSHIDCGRIQDAYSLRCIPQVHGPVRECLEYVKNVAAVEMNSATDNPLVFAEA